MPCGLYKGGACLWMTLLGVCVDSHRSPPSRNPRPCQAVYRSVMCLCFPTYTLSAPEMPGSMCNS